MLSAPIEGVDWSIHVRRLDGAAGDAAVLRHDADRLLLTASLAKVFLLVEVAARLEDGALAPDRELRRGATGPVADSGLWQHLRTDTLSVEDAAVLVGSVSDNLATNALLDVVGLPAVQARAASLATRGSTMHDRVRDHRGPEAPSTLSTGCAADWVDVMTGLDARTVVSPPVSAHVLRWLAAGADLSMVAAALDLDPLSHGHDAAGVRVWNKTGSDDGVRADAGIVRGPRAAVAYAVIAGWDPGAGDKRGDVLARMRGIGAQLRTLTA